MQPGLFDLEVPELEDGAVRVATRWSGVSAGTELAYVKGTDPGFTSFRDPDLGVFVSGRASRAFPVRAMGYMEVGEVVESRRDDMAIGMLVAAAYGHRSEHVLTISDVVVPVPDDIDPLLGIYLAQMGPICANGLLHVAAEFAPGQDIRLGDGVRGRNVLVTGAGVVGLLSALLAQLHGATDVVIADPDPQRLAVAENLGLETIDTTTTEVWHRCKDRWRHGPGDRGADLVLQCRGKSVVLHEALQCLRPQGTVFDLAFYQGGAPDLRLGEEFHHNGLTIRCAQIGRVPRGLADAWDRQRLAAETVALLRARGDNMRAHLVTDVVPVLEAPDALVALARRERSTTQMVLDFSLQS
ncbi:zinc-binding dehydrogenase [Aeromicrobium wangtongii]|uniref:zinc-binding dehydrogenase n=1 Tax=Aeromicrobium wangtongii TaxID=2969247 RepID=UPI00201723A6|nr:zinc-binding dehydrogenase [Aeromicrobium wangtongii]MCL3819368.1 zinc-binding dehydrogenase [Aeromicrobium wangtongii]